MSSSQPQRIDIRRFYEQHERLHNLLAKIESAIAERRGSLSALAASLHELRDYLQSHILLEEKEGYFHDAIAHAPRLKTRADDLQRDHVQLPLLLDQMQTAVEQEDVAEDCWSRIAAMYGEFARRQRSHELGENQLLQEAYTEDTGAGD